MTWDAVLFDLDGTLTDPFPGISSAIRHAIDRLGLAPLSDDELRPFIGPPLHASFRDAFGLDAAGVDAAVAAYRDYYGERGIYEARVYPGIVEVLSSLYADGVTLAVATSKPTPFATRVVDHFGLAGYFTALAGSDLDGARGAKHLVVEHALELLGLEASAAVVMVGDRLHDVEGAAHWGLPCVGVTWGYGPAAELVEAGADPVVESAIDLLAALTGHRAPASRA